MAGKRDDLEIVIGADLSGLASDLSRAAQMAKGMSREIERSAPRTRDFAPRVDTAGLVRTERAARAAGLSLRSATADLVGFGAKVAFTGGALVALEAGLGGIGDALAQVKGSVVMAAEFEQNQIAFETMLGSAQRAAEVMGDLRQFAAETPFSSKEVTQGARQLLAYGIAASDLIPTLKTLGTISAGTATPLGENVYRYGTTRVQGRAMQQDLNQFTNAGIDVYPGIAKALKIDVSEVRKYTEEGRVDINTLNAALEGLANNKFAGMLARQADSLKGSWEQMTDAFDRAKLKLGQVIVRELGLKQATKDAEAFGNRLEKLIDSPFVTGGIRLFGEFAHAVTHLASEIGSAGFDAAKMFGEMADRLPQFRETLGGVRDILKGMKEFKIDPDLVASFAINFAKEALLIGATAVEMGRAFKTDVLDPIRDTLKDLRDTRDFLKGGAGPGGLGKWAGEQFGGQVDPNKRPLVAGALGINRAPQPDDDWATKFVQGIKKASDGLDRFGEVLKERRAAEKAAKEEADWRGRLAEQDKDRRVFHDFFLGRVGELKGVVPGDPLAGIAGYMLGGEKQQRALNDGFGAGWISKGVRDAGSRLGLPPVSGLTPHQMGLANKVKDEFDPLLKLNRDLADLDGLLKAGGISQREFDFARDKEVRGLADSLGLNQPSRLPDTVLAGSQEDARLLAQAMGATQQQTTESLLKIIADHLQAIRNSNRNIEQAPMPRPVNVALPGKG